VEQGLRAKDLVDMVDSVTYCLSKGLCAPVGSVLCGSKEFIQEALRIRKQLGGGMRQAGVLAAAGVVALEEMTDRLIEDHQRAKKLAEALSSIPGVALDNGSPNTNMVYIKLDRSLGLSAEKVAERLRAQGVLAGITGPRHFRLVCHYWIRDEDIPKVARAMENSLSAH
jgi:threonine aldolase